MSPLIEGTQGNVTLVTLVITPGISMGYEVTASVTYDMSDDIRERGYVTA
jgi:hypothetical protein